ncbi:MAG: AAA family ATPase [Microcoleus sp.]
MNGNVNSWQSFLILKIVPDYGLSRTETAILLAKFPDENTFKSNKEVADGAIAAENNEIPIDPENVRRQMWTIYNERFCPTENREGFLGYKDRSSPAKDTAFLAWLKPKYLDWLSSQKSAFSTGDCTPAISCNPFIPQTGQIDDPQLFFGRDREIRRVFEVLNTDCSVALIGEEGIGKSSLLSAICQQAENLLLSARQPIHLDLNGIRDEDDFYTALCEEVGIPKSYGNRLHSALKQNNKKVLLAIDNVGKMTREGFTRELRENLRFLAERPNAPVKLIVAASKPLDKLFNDSHDEYNESPFAGIFQQENIKPWNEAIAGAFIKARLAMTSVRFTDEEISHLVQESGGHPRRLMQLCYQNYARYMEDVK